MPDSIQYLTHSRLACYRACSRRHYLRYELGLTPTETTLALRVGTAFHAALEAQETGADPGAAIEQRLESAYDMSLVAAMFHGHTERWASEQLETVATEQGFDLPLVNPDTGARTNVWRFAGKIDSIVKLPDGRLALMEYKTTSRDFAPGADYWLRLHMDQQLSLYVIAARALGHPVETILYDVTRRPALRPLKATPVDARKYTKAGQLYANQRDTDETPEEFAARVSADIAEKPDHYFARIEIARLDSDLDECRAELWSQQILIRRAQLTGRWFRNPESCVSNNGWPCDYLSICLNKNIEADTPAGFTRSAQIHPELNGVATSAG